MMRKNAVRALSLLILVLLLASGCGTPGAPTADPVSPEPTANPEPTAPPDAETGSEPDAPAAGETDGGDGDETGVIFFGLNETLRHGDLCEMSGLYSEVLDDAAVEEGWFYYYTDTDESPAEVIFWELPEGAYTTVEVLFTVRNVSGAPRSFGDKLTARLLWQETGDSQPVCFDGTVFQQNPGQTEASGDVIMWSTKPVEIGAGESANVSFRFDVPKDVYDKLYARAIGEENGIVETCEFDFGDGTTFAVDLTQALIPASRYAG